VVTLMVFLQIVRGIGLRFDFNLIKKGMIIAFAIGNKITPTGLHLATLGELMYIFSTGSEHLSLEGQHEHYVKTLLKKSKQNRFLAFSHILQVGYLPF
ncbi:hypothetical protein ACJX0J_038486, partial [Zea mays]